MIVDKQALGRLGEDAAVELLNAKGYKILERNWRYSHAEIDIIAKWNNIIVVCEVKSRLTDDFIDPAATVSRKQMKRLADAYAHYADQIGHLGEFRFDIIGVVFVDPQYPQISHYEDVYFE